MVIINIFFLVYFYILNKFMLEQDYGSYHLISITHVNTNVDQLFLEDLIFIRFSQPILKNKELV